MPPPSLRAGLRNLDGQFVVSVRRGDQIVHAVGPEFMLADGDVLFLSGGCRAPPCVTVFPYPVPGLVEEGLRSGLLRTGCPPTVVTHARGSTVSACPHTRAPPHSCSGVPPQPRHPSSPVDLLQASRTAPKSCPSWGWHPTATRWRKSTRRRCRPTLCTLRCARCAVPLLRCAALRRPRRRLLRRAVPKASAARPLSQRAYGWRHAAPAPRVHAAPPLDAFPLPSPSLPPPSPLTASRPLLYVRRLQHRRYWGRGTRAAWAERLLAPTLLCTGGRRGTAGPPAPSGVPPAAAAFHLAFHRTAAPCSAPRWRPQPRQEHPSCSDKHPLLLQLTVLHLLPSPRRLQCLPPAAPR